MLDTGWSGWCCDWMPGGVQEHRQEVGKVKQTEHPNTSSEEEKLSRRVWGAHLATQCVWMYRFIHHTWGKWHFKVRTQSSCPSTTRKSKLSHSLQHIPSATPPTRAVFCPHTSLPEIPIPPFCFPLDSWDGHSSVAAALHKPPLLCCTHCSLCVQNPFQTPLRTSHFLISASCTLAVPQGPLSALLVTSCFPTPCCRWIQHSTTPMSSTPSLLCCLPWARRNPSQPKISLQCMAENKKKQRKICPKKVQQGRLPQAEVMLEWMRQNHWIV